MSNLIATRSGVSKEAPLLAFEQWVIRTEIPKSLILGSRSFTIEARISQEKEEGTKELAWNNDGLEFYLVQVVPENDELNSACLEQELVTLIRSGDAAFVWEGRPYLALVCSDQMAARAVQRLSDEIEVRGIAAKLSLVQEPFEPALRLVAERVVAGWVKIFPRAEGVSWVDGTRRLSN